jgi:hypothetical protein
MRNIKVPEEALSREAEKRMLPMQPATWLPHGVGIDDLQHDMGFEPRRCTALSARWYREFYGV